MFKLYKELAKKYITSGEHFSVTAGIVSGDGNSLPDFVMPALWELLGSARLALET